MKTPLRWAAVFMLTAAAGAQTGLNPKIFHNEGQTDSTTRDTASVDTIYSMQPQPFRTGYGKTSGWRVVLQDQDYRTTESVQLGCVAYASDNVKPDPTPAGLLLNATANLSFPQPASGTASAALWTLTLTTPADMPTHLGLRLILPSIQNTQTDGVYVHTQRGRTSMLPPSVKRPQWTYVLDATSGAAADFWEAGTSLWYGGLWVEPVTRIYTRSSAYGQPEDLFGPESLYPDSTRSDAIGFSIQADAYASQIGLVMLSGGLLAQPIQTGFGPLFMLPPIGVIQLPFVLDATGSAKSPSVLVPPQLKLWAQTGFINPTSGALRVSDATGFSGL